MRHKGFQGYTAALDFVLPNGDIKRYDRDICGEEEMASVAVRMPAACYIRVLSYTQPVNSCRLWHKFSIARHVQVGLGCLGPVSSVSLDICPSYDITQQCYRMPIAEYLENFHAMVSESHIHNQTSIIGCVPGLGIVVAPCNCVS